MKTFSDRSIKNLENESIFEPVNHIDIGSSHFACGFEEPNDEHVSTGYQKILKALEALKHGEEARKVAKNLSWREMEDFVAKISWLTGFVKRTNLTIIVEKRRVQIDVLAATPSLCLVIDCKRWDKQLSGKTLQKIVEKAKQRALLTRNFFQNRYRGESLAFFVPVVVSMHEPASRMVDNVFIVPVNSLKDFLLSAENALAGSAFPAKLSQKWLLFFQDDNLNQSLDWMR